MAKMHRAIQQWDHWLSSAGSRLLEVEQKYLPPLLMGCYGNNVLLIGVPQQHKLLKTNTIPCQTLLSPLIQKHKISRYIEGEYYELPIASGSIDLVLLPHTLEYLDNPHHVLNEACRIVKPEGHIVILGFNLYSLWGLRKVFMTGKTPPWSSNFIPVHTVKKWLALADFELLKHDTFLFRPPILKHDALYQHLKVMEWLGSKLWSPFGGVYVLMAKAKVTPLTPIKLHWKQQLTGIPVSISGPPARNW